MKSFTENYIDNIRESKIKQDEEMKRAISSLMDQ